MSKPKDKSNHFDHQAESHHFFNIKEAANLLRVSSETVRRNAVKGNIPGIKVGRIWRFNQVELVNHLRKQYSTDAAAQGVIFRSKESWHCRKEGNTGGFASPTKEKEYKEALGLPAK